MSKVEHGIHVSKNQLKNGISLDLKPISSHLQQAIVTVDASITKDIYQQTVELFKNKRLDGFTKETVPSEYIEQTFHDEINKKIKNYLFKHVVIDYLIHRLTEKKILVSNYPRLESVSHNDDKSLTYNFSISTTDKINFKEWKHFSFKPPKRKKYKDLDKQVVQFLDQVAVSSRKLKLDTIEENDWVNFQATLLNSGNNKLLPTNIPSNFWIKVKKSEIVEPLGALFVGKSLHESFTTNNLDIDGSINDYENYRYNFLIKVNAIIKGTYLSLDCFKNTFKLKNKSEIHNKLMEVFSYRNDQSQRRSIIEEIFHLFLSKHRFEVPKHLVLRRQEDILETLSKQPDYQVYKAQSDFINHIELLAEKQLKEETLIDQIAYNENIKIELKDMQNYLHLFNNKRLKEFVYFKPMLQRIEQTNRPMNEGLLARTILREKTLNYIIHVLTH